MAEGGVGGSAAAVGVPLLGAAVFAPVGLDGGTSGAGRGRGLVSRDADVGALELRRGGEAVRSTGPGSEGPAGGPGRAVRAPGRGTDGGAAGREAGETTRAPHFGQVPKCWIQWAQIGAPQECIAVATPPQPRQRPAGPGRAVRRSGAAAGGGGWTGGDGAFSGAKKRSPSAADGAVVPLWNSGEYRPRSRAGSVEWLAEPVWSTRWRIRAR